MSFLQPSGLASGADMAGSFHATAHVLAMPAPGMEPALIWIVFLAVVAVLFAGMAASARPRDSAGREGIGAKYLSRERELKKQRRPLQIPRALMNNPYSAEFRDLTLSKRVEIAAESSARASRRIGAIVLPLPVPHQPGSHLHDPQFADRFALQLRRFLRTSDYAGPAGDRRIVVFVSLLKNADDLYAIAERLQRIASGCFEECANVKPGVALYPLDGYTAEELFDTASRRALAPAGETARLPALPYLPLEPARGA
ncbi:MAG: hypothetical protein AB7F96_11435 [Beijerinckiaceae bacterium]